MTTIAEPIKAGNILLYSVDGQRGPNGPFELGPEQILCNNIIFKGEFNPHNCQLWVIGNEYGALGAVWADCEQDALDELVDADLGGGLLIDGKDADDETSRLGNTGEPANLDYAWMAQVELRPDRDFKLMMRLAEARGACQDTLDK